MSPGGNVPVYAAVTGAAPFTLRAISVVAVSYVATT